ncbi:MAG: hypothetical protein WDM76_04800 [Limisphaerales bacterium]
MKSFFFSSIALFALTGAFLMSAQLQAVAASASSETTVWFDKAATDFYGIVADGQWAARRNDVWRRG